MSVANALSTNKLLTDDASLLQLLEPPEKQRWSTRWPWLSKRRSHTTGFLIETNWHPPQSSTPSTWAACRHELIMLRSSDLRYVLVGGVHPEQGRAGREWRACWMCACPEASSCLLELLHDRIFSPNGIPESSSRLCLGRLSILASINQLSILWIARHLIRDIWVHVPHNIAGFCSWVKLPRRNHFVSCKY